MRMCSVRHYLDQIAQHELDSDGPVDPEQKIQLQNGDLGSVEQPRTSRS